MKKVLLFAGMLFLSAAVLSSCGAKEEAKDDDKKEESKEDDKEDADEADEADEASTPTGATNWPAEAYDAYMKSCVDSAKETFGEDKATTYCDCTASKLQEAYPDATQLGSLGADEIQQVAMDCLK